MRRRPRWALSRSSPARSSQQETQAAPIKEDEIETVRELWREYWDSLGFPDDFQHFGEELASLPSGYRSLLIEWVDGKPAGTVALRPLRRVGEAACELKRMYVRPAFRGCGLGHKLLARAMAEARALGYTEIYADTMPSMASALRMYREAGFSETAPYSDQPTPCAIFLRFAL